MFYRLLCNFNNDFGLLVFVVYLAAFLLALLLVFIFPPGALALVLLGILGLVGIWLLTACTRAIERSIGRRALVVDRCPACGGATSAPVEKGGLDHVFCVQCRQAFEPDGRRVDLDEEEEDSDEDLREV